MANKAKDKAKQQIRKQGAQARDVLILQKAMNDTGKNIVHLPSARTAPISVPTIAPETQVKNTLGAGVGSLVGLGVPAIPAYESIPVISAPEQVIAEYNSIPEYGALSRLFSKEKNDAYNRKQEISQSQEYKDAIKNNPTIRTPRESASWAWDNLVRPSLQILMDDETYKGTPMGGGIPLMANPLASKPMQGIGALVTRPVESAYNVTENVEDYLAGRPIKARDTLTETLTKSAVSDLGKFENIGRGLLSTADTAIAMGISALTGSPQIGRIIQTLEQSADVMDRAAERGLNPNQIMAEGILSGAVTYATEKIPFETALDVFKNPASKGVMSIIMAMVEGGLPEAGQEAIEEICDVAMQMLVERDKSEYIREVKTRVSNGENPLRVAQEIGGKVLKEAVINAIWGFLGGGLFRAGRRLSGDVPSLNTNNETNVEEKAPEIPNVEENVSEAKPISDDVQNHIDDLARQQNDLGVELADVNERIKKTNGDERRELRHRASAIKQEIANIDNQINSVKETGEIPSANVPVEENVENTPQDVLAIEPQAQNEAIQANEVKPAELQEMRKESGKTETTAQPIEVEKSEVSEASEAPQLSEIVISDRNEFNKQVNSLASTFNGAIQSVGDKNSSYANAVKEDIKTFKNNPTSENWNKLIADFDTYVEQSGSKRQQAWDGTWYTKDIRSKSMFSQGGESLETRLRNKLDAIAKAYNIARSNAQVETKTVEEPTKTVEEPVKEEPKKTTTKKAEVTEESDEWENRNRKAVKKNKDEIAVTQYARNTLYNLPSVKANKDVQQYLLDEEAKGTMSGKVVHNEDSVKEAKMMLAAAKEVYGNVDGVINKLINSEQTISNFGALEQDELQLALDIKLNEAHKSGNFKGIRKMIRGSVLGETNIAQALQALAKYSHTASSAITKAEALIHGITESYKKNPLTKKRAELNSKLAKALVQMGDDTKAEANVKTPKTHEEIVESVRNTLETEYSSISRKFTDADVEFIASMLEANTPVNTIQDELEHWFKHGKWYTLDESIEIKPETFKKLDKILAESGNKLADVKKEIEPLSQSRKREQIRASLAQEFSSISDKFTEKDIDFIINMFEENIPKWQIRDEIEYFLREGEWYTLDESIENPKPMSKEISRALDIAINGTPEEKAKVEKTVSQIEEEIRNRLDEEPAKIRNKFNDTDIKFLANRIMLGEDAKVINDMINRKLKTGYFEISDEDLNFVVETYDAVNSGELSSKEEYFLMQQANARLAKYLGKGTLMERLNQWRYFMMLHALPTHLANVESNVFWGTVTMFKDSLAAVGEEVYSRTKKGKDFERTKAIITHKDGELVKAGWKDFADWAWAEYARGGNKHDDRSEIKRAQQIGAKGISTAAEANNNLLEQEDIISGRIKYSQALAGYLKGNGKNESIFESRDVKDRALLERARNYALKEAKLATHHEDNVAAAALTRASRSTQEGGLLGFNFAIESLIPFKRTTSNVGRKFMVDYNPLVQGVNAARLTYQAIANDGDVAETIDSYAKTLTGAGLVRLGWWLASKGLLVARRDDDDKDDVLKKAKNYAITWIDSKGNLRYRTIDRLAPTAMLVCVGAELFEEGGMSADAFWGMADSFMENTLLSGFNGLIDEIERASWDKEKHKGFTIGAKLLNSYFSQYIPTSFGKLARTIDPISRDTYYTGYKGDKDTVAKYGKQLINKIPFASFLLEPRVNVYGEEEKNVGGNFWGRLAYNFFATGQYSKRERDDIQNKIAELDAFSQTLNGTARATMEKQLNDLLDDPSSSFDGEKLSPEEYTKLRKATGESAVELFSALVNADDFNALTPEAQAQLMDEMGLFARALGKRKALGLDTKTYAQKFADYEHGADAVVNGMIKKYLLDSGGIQSNSAAGKELLQLDNLSADDIAKVTGITADEQLASQQKIADEIPTLDKSLIMSSNGNWVNPETAIPYLDSLGLDDATQGEILYNNGKRSQKEIDAFNDMGGYEGVKRYYDIKEYGLTHNGSGVSKGETIEYLETLGLSADEINAWMKVFNWEADYSR